MKKLIVILIVCILTGSLAGCSSTPSEEKIKQALEDGTITLEDAMSKGWIDQEWIDANYERLDAFNKIYLFDPFTTTYLDGTEVSSKIIEGKMCLVFFNTQGETTMEQLSAYNEVSAKMKELDVPVLGIVTDKDLDTAREKLGEIDFPIIVYNEEMQKSLELYEDIIKDDIVSVFTKQGGIYTAWNSKVQADELLKYAEALANEE